MSINTLNLSKQIAIKAHDKQFRRDGITPYIAHPEAVANSLTDVDEKSVAWLHDVIEDSDITDEYLRQAGIPEHIILATKILTKPRHTFIHYTQYLQNVKQNSLAKAVKIKDMEHNLNDAPTEKQKKKYSAGLLYLKDKITYDELVKIVTS
jgi:(p)ppGpp synthase/HD superfamily hydrolase